LRVGGIGAVAVVGDVDGPGTEAGAGVGVGEEASRASRAFNAIALVVNSVSISPIGENKGNHE